MCNRSPSLSPQNQVFYKESQEAMNCDGTPVKALPAPRRKTAPQHSSQPSIEAMQLQMEVKDQECAHESECRWKTCDKKVLARTAILAQERQ